MIKNLTLSLLLILTSISINAQVGIGNSNPQGILDISSTNDGLLIPRVALTSTTTATVITPTKSELVYNTATAGDVTPGYYYWETTPTVASDRWVRLMTSSANNDWSLIGNSGTTAGTNFIGTTDAQDLRFKTQGSDRLNISNTNGQVQSYFAGTAAVPAYSWNSDPDTGMMELGSDILGFATNGVERLKMNTTESVVNDSQNNYDFRIEGDNTQYALFSDASTDTVIFGSIGNLSNNGSNFNTSGRIFATYNTVIDYVADFDNGTSRGTTMGLGSIEFLVDGEAELFVSDTFSPTSDLTYDLGSGIAWDDIYADDFWNISDIRAKKDITPMKYGLKEIMKLNTIAYKLKDDPFQDKKIGLIAQEVNQFIPEASKTKDNIKNEKGEFKEVELETIRVSYVNLVPVLVKSIQEQQEMINLLKEEIELLKKKK